MPAFARCAPLLATGLAAAALIACAGGCSKDHSTSVRDVLSINAVAFNDSVGGNDTLYLKVQYMYPTTCDQNAHFEVAALGGANYLVVPVATHRANDPCTGVNGVGVATLRVTDLGDGPRTFSIQGANDTLVANVLGSTDPAFVTNGNIVFRVQVEDAGTGAPIANAHVQIRNVDDNSTLDDDFTDATGHLAFEQPCGPDLAYVVSASANGRTTNLVVHVPPARCRIPEAVVIHV
jgi:hypothetical protein